MEKVKYTGINEYIKNFPEEIQQKLQQMRDIIKSAAPDAEEKISYNMPAYFYNGVLVYFAAFQNHIGFYPTPSGIKEFSKDIEQYKSSKGAVQFPLDKPLPVQLIKRIVKFRVQENKFKPQVKLTNKK